MPQMKQEMWKQLARLDELRKKSSSKNFFWMMLGQGLGYVFQAAYFVMLARLLGSRQYGVFAGAFAFTSLVSPYSSLGMGTIYLRYISGGGTDKAAYWGNILMASLLISGILTMVLQIAGSHFLNPESARLVFLAALSNCFCYQLVTECSRIFQAAERMQVTAMLSLLSNATRVAAVGAMLVVLHRASAWQWTIASLIVSAIAAVIAVSSVIYCFGAPHFRPSLLRSHAIEGLGFSFATSASTVYNDVDKTMLSHYGMNEANGIYTTAYRVIDFATMPILALRDSAAPKLFAAGRTSLAAATGLSYRLLRPAFAFSLVISVGLLAAAPLLTHVVGKSFADSVSAVRWLAFIPVLRSIHQMTGSGLFSTGNQRYRTANQLIAATFNFGLNLWLIPSHGWRGAAWASLATDGLLALMNWLTIVILNRARFKTQSSSL